MLKPYILRGGEKVAISLKIQDSIKNASWIRKIFEEGNERKAKYGAENVLDFSLGNPNLEPEKSTAWDAGVEQGLWKGARVRGTYFENRITDMIYQEDTTPDLREKINIGEARIRGIELEFSQLLRCGLSFFVNYSYTDARVKKNRIKPETEGARLTMVPAHLLNAGLRYEAGKFTATVTGKYVSKRYSDDLNRDRVNNVLYSYDPFFTADTKLSYAMSKFLTFSFGVENIFDRDYYSSYKAPGRKLFGEVTAQF